MEVHIPTKFPDFFSLWKESLGFGTSQTDRQTGKPHLRRRTDSQHECEPKIKYRFNIPEAFLPGRAGAELPTFSPLQGAGQRPGRLGPSGLVQSRLGKRLRYLLLGSPRPQMQGSRLPPGEGSPGHRSRRCPPSFPPSLPHSRPPSLSPSLARCRSRGPPAGNLFWTKSRYLRKREREKEKRTSYVGKKDPQPRLFSTLRPLAGLRADAPDAALQLQGCAGPAASPALTAAPRALRAPHSGPPPPGSPNTKQTSRSFLQTQHPVARLAAGLRPGARSAPSAAKVHTQSTLSELSRQPDTPPSQGARRATLGPRPCPGPQTSSPCTGPTQSPVPTLSPQSPAAAALHLFPRKAASRSRGKAVGPGGGSRGAGERRSQGGHRGSAGLSRSPRSPRDISETKALLGELLPFPPSPTSLKHSHAGSSAL